MTATNQLPAVASDFYTYCKKCDSERYHKVLAHTSSTSAKIKCEVCASTKKYSLPKAPSASRKAAGAALAARNKVARESARRTSHTAEYEALLQNNESTPTQAYNMKGKFELNHKLQHPKFGLGFIRAIQPDKIEVVFPDEVRTLIHNRV